MSNQWFKMYGSEYLSDPKMLSLDANYRSCWITLLCYASQNDGNIRYLNEDQLKYQSGVTNDFITSGISVLERFVEMEMILITEKGIFIKNWKKRQESYLTGYERNKKYREKQKLKKDKVTNGDTNGDTKVTLEENRIEKNRVEESRKSARRESPIKESFGELKSVKLTTEEHSKLLESFGEKNLNMLIFELDTYIQSSGKKYLSHYATLLNWAKRKWDVQEEKKKTIKKKIAF